MRPSASYARLALLGTGYIGGSVARAARERQVARRVIGFDPDRGAAEVALARAVVDEVASTPAQAVEGADLVVLAAPVRSLGNLAREIAAAVGAGTLVIDVGSVKGPVVQEVGRALGGAFVGCHPLAGTERSGPAAADETLFMDKLCFVCPTSETRSDALAAATRLWEALGSRVLRLAPDHHDAIMAATSHLPHVAAFALAAALAQAAPLLEGDAPGAGPTTSLRDTTRIAASSPAVWRDILLENRRHLLPLVRALEARVAEMRAAMEVGDEAALEAVLAEGRRMRQRLVGGG